MREREEEREGGTRRDEGKGWERRGRRRMWKEG